MGMGLQTIVLKLHKPSKAKQKIIDDALQGYNMALQFLVKNVQPYLQELREKSMKKGQLNIHALSKWIDKELSIELNRFGVQPFKDSLKLDFAFVMANYLRKNNSFKKIGNKEAYEDTRDDMLNFEAYGKPKPVYFCRYDTKRNYCILYDRENDRYFAKLYLLNGAEARAVSCRNEGRGALMYLHKDGSLMEKSKRKETFIVVPLSFGKWQENILKEAAKTPESFKTARLFKRDGEYYLAVSIIVSEGENKSTFAYMGISRGLKNKLNYTIVDSDGEVLSHGRVECSGAFQNCKLMSLNEIHACANFIVDKAAAFNAQVLMENLNGKGDRLNWIENGQDSYSALCKWKDYFKLNRILEYKLQWRNLPKPIKVSAVDIFYKCWCCGLNSKKSRQTADFFICTGCGSAIDVDKLGSLNLARKLISYRASKIKIGISKNEEGVIFKNDILDLELFVSFKENPRDKIKGELQKIIENVKKYDEDYMPTKKSLIRKLENARDFMDLIEYI